MYFFAEYVSIPFCMIGKPCSIIETTNQLPFGKGGISPLLMGELTISVGFLLIAMLNYQGVTIYDYIYKYI